MLDKEEFRILLNYLEQEFYLLKQNQELLKEANKETDWKYPQFIFTIRNNTYNNICLSIYKLIDKTKNTLYYNIEKLINDKETKKKADEIRKRLEIRRHNILAHINYEKIFAKYKDIEDLDERYTNYCKHTLSYNITLETLDKYIETLEDIRDWILIELWKKSQTDITNFSIKKMYWYTNIAADELKQIKEKWN